MKVKIIRNFFKGELEEQINNFIKLVKSENIIDIKYCEDNDYGSALIMYKDL